jgi:3D (Asp-Asp-Asp) domain-containing protein
MGRKLRPLQYGVAAAAIAAALFGAVRTIQDATHHALADDFRAQVRPGATLLFRARAGCLDARTSSGAATRRGMIAADVSLLPIGSVVQVEGAGRTVDGIYSVMDGKAGLQGPLIELHLDRCDEAEKFGERAVQVKILRLGWPPGQSAP